MDGVHRSFRLPGSTGETHVPARRACESTDNRTLYLIIISKTCYLSSPFCGDIYLRILADNLVPQTFVHQFLLEVCPSAQIPGIITRQATTIIGILKPFRSL
jgi:hypothetical protein